MKAGEIWTVTLKRLEAERPRKLVLGSSTLEMACPHSLKEWRLPHGFLVSSGAEIWAYTGHTLFCVSRKETWAHRLDRKCDAVQTGV